MPTLRTAVLAGMLSLALPAIALAQAPTTLTVPLGAQNNSGITGSAVITDLGGGKSRVAVTVTGARANTVGPGHIHDGACPGVGGVKFPLTNLANGTSTTEIATSLADLVAGKFAINVHETGVSGVPGYMACGNVVAAAGAMPATGYGTRAMAIGGTVASVVIGALTVGLVAITRRKRARAG